jgi:cell division protein FtsZ
MSDRGLALMGTGRSGGDKRAVTAMQQAIHSPLLEEVTIDGATGLLINITGGRDLTLQEVNEALTLVHDSADPEAEIIFGSLISDEMQDEVKITIIATGFQHRDTKMRSVAPSLPMMSSRPPPPPPVTLTPARHEEVASLVPSKAAPRPTLVANEGRPPAPRPALKDAVLPADEDQFDIPTFLRRQGHTELP